MESQQQFDALLEDPGFLKIIDLVTKEVARRWSISDSIARSFVLSAVNEPATLLCVYGAWLSAKQAGEKPRLAKLIIRRRMLDLLRKDARPSSYCSISIATPTDAETDMMPGALHDSRKCHPQIEPELQQLTEMGRRSALARDVSSGGRWTSKGKHGNTKKAISLCARTYPKKHVILFLAANPCASSLLKLGEECAEIQRELKMTLNRDDFHFESRWAVSIDEFMRHLTELDPTVLHFAGHGGNTSGLMLQDEQGQLQEVSARALAMMVDAAAHNVRVVVLNACYSAAQIDLLRTKVDCIVGMDGAIGDDAARAFAIRFYGALGNRRSIGNAVAQGIATLAAKQLADAALPRCLTRDGVDAHKLVLAQNL